MRLFDVQAAGEKGLGKEAERGFTELAML